MSLAEKILRERQRSAAQRPEVWLLREYLKRRRENVRASRLRSLAAAPDRPELVAISPEAAGDQPRSWGGENSRRSTLGPRR